MSNENISKVKVQRKPNEGIKFCVSSIILMLFCTFLLIVSTFLQFNVTHFVLPEGLFSGEKFVLADCLFSYKFIPQIPVVLFVGAFLGRRYGMAAVVLYILIGLFFAPVFALGGGLKYIAQYGFGYILAYIPAVFIVASILKDGFLNKNILKAVILSVLAIHLIGVLYMLVIALILGEGLGFMQGWIVAQSGIKIVYDVIFSFFAIFLAKYARLLLWAYL